jgi:hypothetical protein
VTDHLLAAAVDHLAAANWMFACVNSEEGEQPEPPVPVPRPGDAEGTAEEEDRQTGAQTETVREPGDGATPSAVQLARFFG